MRLVYLIPPSEGKRDGGERNPLSRSFELPMPIKMMSKATERDLKCTGKRFAEARLLNAEILSGPTLTAIERYDGVMYSNIGYESLSSEAKEHFDDSVLILSGLFGLVRPTDRIPNYKLPIEAKGLAAYWKPKVTKLLADMEGAVFVDMLPLSYRKMIDWSKLRHYVTVDFVNDGGERLGHDVKPVKGKWIREAMEAGVSTIGHLHEQTGSNALPIPGILRISPSAA